LNKPLPPEVQRRLRALYCYVRAMESGDLESIANLLCEAEQDAVLDRMFQEIDMHYQDQVAVQPGELAAIHQRAVHLFMQELERVQAQQNGDQNQTTPVFPLPQERRQTAMPYRPTSFIREEETDGMPQVQLPDQKPHRKRSTHFLQMLAAVLLVGGLLAGFLMLFASRPHSRNSQVASQPTPQVQPPGTFIAVSSAASAANPMETFEAYGLRAANNIPIWSTFLVQSDGTPGSVVIQNQVAYILIANDVFALQIDTGTLLWKKTLPFEPLSNTALRVEGDVLIAGGQDTNGFASLYRLNEQDGSVLWHYQTGADRAFAIGNGVVYTGKDEVTSMFTHNPGTLRLLVALNATNGNVMWSHDNIDPLGITVQNGTIYVQSIAADNTGSDKRYFLSAWTSSGDKLWLETGPAQEPVAIDGGFLMIDTGSDLCAYRADNGHQAWCTHNPTQTFSPGGMTTTVGPSYASYVAQNGVLYAAYSMQTSDTSTHQSTASFLQALNIQTGTVIWSQKVGTSDVDITHKGSQTVIGMYKNVGLQFGSDSSILLSQNTLSIMAGTSIYTFSLADGQQLWQSTIRIAGDLVNFVGSVYIAPQRS
jgi:outer membrane protein assembly factor BamB